MSPLTPPLHSTLRRVHSVDGVRGGVRELGSYLREQRERAQLSVRQLSKATGISNPYLSQIERGLRRPSAEILQALAKGLEVSAESLYVRAGLLDPGPGVGDIDTRAALTLDSRLSPKHRAILLDLYDSFATTDPVATAATDATADPLAPPPLIDTVDAAVSTPESGDDSVPDEPTTGRIS